MGDFVAGLVRLMLQVALLAAGLVVAAGLVLAAAVLAVVFGLRLLWAKITGRPVIIRFGSMGVDPAASWRRYRDWQARSTAQPPRAARAGAHLSHQDIEDVEPKEPSSR